MFACKFCKFLEIYFFYRTPLGSCLCWSQIYHSHKKRKDSLETLAEPAAFSLKLEFRKLSEPSLRKPASNINKQGTRGTIKQLKVKGLSSCFVLIWESSHCLSFNWHSSKAAPGISFFRVPTKDDEYSIKTGETTLLQLLLVIPYGDEGNLKRQIKNRTFALSLRKHVLP